MLMTAVLGCIDLATALLAIAAIAKIADPDATAALLARGALGIRIRRPRRARLAARLVGAAELAVVAAVVVGGAPAYGLLAACYGLFVLILAGVVRSGGASCGCFGVRSAPPTRLHVGVNLFVAVLATVAAVESSPSLGDRLGDASVAAVSYLVFVGIGAALLGAIFTSAAELAPLLGTARARHTHE